MVALNLTIAVYEMKEIVPTYELAIIDRGGYAALTLNAYITNTNTHTEYSAMT